MINTTEQTNDYGQCQSLAEYVRQEVEKIPPWVKDGYTKLESKTEVSN